MNKLNCCIPINFEDHTRKPLPPLFPTDSVISVTWDVFPPSPGTWPNDEVTYNPDEDSSVTEIRTSGKKVSAPTLARTPKRNDGTAN